MAINELQSQEGFYKTLFEEHSAPMFIFARDGRILKANGAALKFYGYTKEELESKYVYNINIMPKEKVLAAAYKAFKKNQNVFLFKHKLKNGEIRDVRVYASPSGIDGEKYLLAVINDITYQTRYQKIFAAIKGISQTAISVESQEEFFTNLVHALVKKAGFTAAFIMTVNPENTKLVSAARCNNASDRLKHLGLEHIINTDINLISDNPALKTPSARAFSENKIFINSDAKASHDTKSKTHLSSAAIPVLKNFVPVGSLCICQDEPFFFDNYVDMLEEIKNTVSLTVEKLEDIAEKKAVQDRLKESEEMFRTLADGMQSGLVMYKDKFIYANPMFQNMLGYTQEELKGLSAVDMMAKEFKEDVKASVSKGLEDPADRRNVIRKAVKKSGEELWINASAGSVKFNGEIVRITSIVDITEMVNLRSRLEQERDLFEILIENIHSGIALYDKDKFIYVNSVLPDLFGRTKKELLDMDIGRFFDISENQLYNANPSVFKIYRDDEIPSRFIYSHKDEADKIRYIDLFKTPVAHNGKDARLAIFSDVTDHVLKERNILTEKETFRELSRVDFLTGIANRRAFDSKLEELFDLAGRYLRPLSLIMFDIDHFKNINDTYGHDLGDLILKDIAAIAGKHLRKTDFFARYGGEEFMVIAPETAIETAKELAERLRLKIRDCDFNIGRSVTVSFGVTSLNGGDIAQNMVYRADMAMYKAKENGRDRVEAL